MLRQCIEPLGLTITDAAAALGVTRTTLSELVNEKRGISPEMAVRLSKVFGGSAESWLTQQAHYDLAKSHRPDQTQAAGIGLKPADPRMKPTGRYTATNPARFEKLWAGGPGKAHEGGRVARATLPRVPRPSRVCLGGDFCVRCHSGCPDLTILSGRAQPFPLSSCLVKLWVPHPCRPASGRQGGRHEHDVSPHAQGEAPPRITLEV